MVFYSHTKKDKDGNISPIKELEVHLKNVQKEIIRNYHSFISFENFNLDNNVFNAIGLFHDLGKYTTFFQDYLFEKYKGDLKKHSFISANFTFNFLNNRQNDLEPYLIYYCIKHHHINLTTPSKKLNKTYMLILTDNLKNQIQDILLDNDAKKEIENLVNLYCKKDFKLCDNCFHYDEKFIKRISIHICNQRASIENYFFIIYFFSLLISSDKIDAAEASKYQIHQINPDLVNQFISAKQNKSLENIRNKAKSEIEDKLSEIDYFKDRIFTLTAPTGIGKTLSVMNFALKLKDKISKNGKYSYNPQIIYCLPFINIIEQTYQEFENLLKFENKKVEILKHHQYSDIFSMLNKMSENQDEEEELSKKMLEVEDWQSDIIITTFVQFFHSVISNRNKMLKKFYRIAGSIIILDEIQNIKAEYWPLIGLTLYYLTKFFNCKIILMTATQPLIFETAKKEFKDELNEFSYKELLNTKEKEFFFKSFNRTKIVSLIDKKNPLKDADEFYKIFSKKWNSSKSCLIVVNTIKRSLEIFNKLKNEIKTNKIYYLSTNIVPIHRKYVIRRVKQLLKIKEKVILVSTQCIEAGVDLDFGMGFRDIGPIDSIIQVAGRINRNDRQGYLNSPLYVINFAYNSERIYGKILINTTIEVLNGKKEFYENDYLELIKNYYNLITGERTSFQESRDLYKAMKHLRFSKEDQELSIEDFKLIDDLRTDYVDVFVPLTKKADRTLDTYLNDFLPCKDFNKRRNIFIKIKSDFNMYKLSVPLKLIKEILQESPSINVHIENKFYSINKTYIGLINNKINLEKILYDYLTGFCREKIKPEHLIL
ncbi:MAG: CRISPR-associated helicase Cas3' [Bacteroidales bacterium]|nr:CRISPR-associated helicase Cas3' [Bacteroidales bacterium]